ncbi:hypothetical protein [Polaribacter sp. Z022]|uniref:hypothetical protein n=1 Tax=Polaribacter sp. Z022 TaxID=2927125 RepID=UPI00202259B7|nr:hypothetical protein [Polaribacter sp. Z022]MCL7755112.1 hypothetical protein [Polaribacter sp. Z022]
MKNLENFGVKELTTNEAVNIDGGNWLKLLRAIVVAAAAVHEELCPGPEYHRTSFHAMDRGAW